MPGARPPVRRSPHGSKESLPVSRPSCRSLTWWPRLCLSRGRVLAAVLALSVGMLPSLSIAEGAAAYEQPELNPHIKSVIEADGYRFIDLALKPVFG